MFYPLTKWMMKHSIFQTDIDFMSQYPQYPTYLNHYCTRDDLSAALHHDDNVNLCRICVTDFLRTPSAFSCPSFTDERKTNASGPRRNLESLDSGIDTGGNQRWLDDHGQLTGICLAMVKAVIVLRFFLFLGWISVSCTCVYLCTLVSMSSSVRTVCLYNTCRPQFNHLLNKTATHPSLALRNLTTWEIQVRLQAQYHFHGFTNVCSLLTLFLSHLWNYLSFEGLCHNTHRFRILCHNWKQNVIWGLLRKQYVIWTSP